jgi:hypothetical protein
MKTPRFIKSKSVPQPVSANPKPSYRRLRGYAFDPSLSIRLETMGINEIIYKVPWEDDLAVGPVGEYLEVVDYDPASTCFYAPLDLSDAYLLAQDGLAPSVGNPQFHQQMVYAVAMTTISNFEQALGRKMLWRSHTRRGKDGTEEEEFVGQLRIYPHALREANAFYSPAKKALLFGYFPATAKMPGTHQAGGTVFTCLSHDIVAHETTHALLDGMHRRFIENSHPDALAFHEAFSDIVALFQHFSFPEVLRHQIGRTRGDLASENLLGQLAQEFGTAIGNYGSLRDALGGEDPDTGVWKPKEPNPQDYVTVLEPHDRGSILVAAVFDAFTSIYRLRVADLMRIASGGTGVLPNGALHPDLVNRLAQEATKAAKHVLLMCVRALDYCPPVDLTYGDYLRALVTADRDIVPDDDRGYRVAFIEAFRRRGIYPTNIRNLSIESLVWPAPYPEEEKQFENLARKLKGIPTRAHYFNSRKEAWDALRKMRAALYGLIQHEFSNLPPHLTGLALKAENRPAEIELDHAGFPKFEIHSIVPAQRVGPDGDILNQLVVSITQSRGIPLDPNRPDDPPMIFRGGCTLILDLDNFCLRHYIVKPIYDNDRLLRQKEYVSANSSGSLRATYFSPLKHKTLEEPFALLHRGT